MKLKDLYKNHIKKHNPLHAEDGEIAWAFDAPFSSIKITDDNGNKLWVETAEREGRLKKEKWKNVFTYTMFCKLEIQNDDAEPVAYWDMDDLKKHMSLVKYRRLAIKAWKRKHYDVLKVEMSYDDMDEEFRIDVTVEPI